MTTDNENAPGTDSKGSAPAAPPVDTAAPAAPAKPTPPPPRGQQQRPLARAAATQPPSVGRIVHFIDREMAIHAAHLNDQAKGRGLEANHVPEPFAAVITRVHVDKAGVLTGMVGLNVFDPEMGPQIKRDVPFSPEYDAGHWSWPPFVR